MKANKITFVATICKRRDDEDVVLNDLAVTPSQMMELTQKGFSIASSNLRMLDLADSNDKDFYVPLQYRRGFDMNDAFEHSRDVRQAMQKTFDDVDKGNITPISNTSE